MVIPTFSKNTVTTVVVNETLYFLQFDSKKRHRIVHEAPLNAYIDESAPDAPRPSALDGAANSLLILPDYWAGTVTYPFQSRKKSLAQAFIGRKLVSEHPAVPDIANFFDFEFSRAGSPERMVHVSFLQEPRAYQLYETLAEQRLAPDRILTPAGVWERKLLKSISDFDIGSGCLVHLLSRECYLYFFFQGRSLFSRRIVLAAPKPEPSGETLALAMEAPDKFSVLTFEINQSLYLFSQKTKADLEKIHLAAPDPGDAEQLSAKLNRDVIPYAAGEVSADDALSASAGIEALGPVGVFGPEDLTPGPNQRNLTHAKRRQFLEWRPVQMLGIAVGFLLILLMALEGVYLYEQRDINREEMMRGRNMSGNTQRQIIQEYSEVLNLLLEEADRPSTRRVIIDVGRALPVNAWVTMLDIKTENTPKVMISGIIKADRVITLKETLSKLLENLAMYFQGAQSLSLEDINFNQDQKPLKTSDTTYSFSFEFELP